ncbi:MAG: potassium/proton antiporter [Gemmatimonadaceae bacterium]|nr:potassium/proton antiporter [Gemmatimonadaceae bacterium]
MPATEPLATAVLVTVIGILLGVSVLFSRASERSGVPVALIFLIIGIIAGSEGIGGIAFESYEATARLGTLALVLILFDAGLNTPVESLRKYLAPAAVLATLGVIGTALLVAAAAHALGFPWTFALVLGAVVSPTDAAAVFAVLRNSGIHLKRRVGLTLEAESGLNDPMAVILTTVLTANLLNPGEMNGLRVGGEVLLNILIGVAFGVGIGYGGRWLLVKVRLAAGGLYVALMISFALLSFGAPTVLGGSGFLSVYIAAVLLGAGTLPYRTGLLRVHDALAWLAQIAMFLLLGLLVSPSRMLDVAVPGIILAVFLTFIARPVVTALSLFPFRYPTKDVAYVGWVGLRGAVPIVLATFVILSRASGSEKIFDLVFFIVVVNALIPGMTVGWVTRRLGLESGDPPMPRAVLEIESLQPLSESLTSFYIDEDLDLAGVQLEDIPFPESAGATLIVRGSNLIPPKPSTTLAVGDHLYVFSKPEDLPFIQLMFGRPEEK